MSLGELIRKADMAEERICELEDMSMETFKMEMQRDKRLKKQTVYLRTWTTIKNNIGIIRILDREERNRSNSRSNND